VSTITDADIKERTQVVIDDVGIDADEATFRGALWDAGLVRVQYPRPPRRCSGRQGRPVEGRPDLTDELADAFISRKRRADG
jgi:hypothetical protein